MDHPPPTPAPRSLLPPVLSPLGGPHADKVRKTGFGFSLGIHGFLLEKMKFSDRRGQYAFGICPCGVFHLASLFRKHHYLRYQREPTQPDWTVVGSLENCSLFSLSDSLCCDLCRQRHEKLVQGFLIVYSHVKTYLLSFSLLLSVTQGNWFKMNLKQMIHLFSLFMPLYPTYCTL